MDDKSASFRFIIEKHLTARDAEYAKEKYNISDMNSASFASPAVKKIPIQTRMPRA